MGGVAQASSIVEGRAHTSSHPVLSLKQFETQIRSLHLSNILDGCSGCYLVHRTSVIDSVLSDHYAVRCKVLLPKPPLERKEITYRSLQQINFSRFREDIRNLDLLDNDIAPIGDQGRFPFSQNFRNFRFGG